MRIGLTGGGSHRRQDHRAGQRAEADGFTSLWYASAVAGDPLVADRRSPVGRRNDRARHRRPPDLSVPPAAPGEPGRVDRRGDGRPGFTIGVGPSHEPVVEACSACRTTGPARTPRSTSTILTSVAPRRGRRRRRRGVGPPTPPAGLAAADHPIPVLLAALGAATLRVAAGRSPTARSAGWHRRSHRSNTSHRSSTPPPPGGRPPPRRVVAGLPIVVHDDLDEARRAVAAHARVYGSGLPNYDRILDLGGARPSRRRHRRRRGRGPGGAAVGARRRRHRHLGQRGRCPR